MSTFCAYAWRLRGMTGSDPGILIFDGERLDFRTVDSQTLADWSEVESIRYPWYYFGGGFKCRIRGEEFRFSLVMPNNGQYPDDSLAEGLSVASEKQKRGAGYRLSESLGTVADGRKMTKELRAMFSKKPGS